MPTVNSALFTSRLKYGTRLPSTGPNAGVPVIRPTFTTLSTGQVVPILSNNTVSTTTPSTPPSTGYYPPITGLNITDVTSPEGGFSFTAPVGAFPDSYSVVVNNNTTGNRVDALIYPPTTSGRFSIPDPYYNYDVTITAIYGTNYSSPVTENLTTQP